MLGAKIADRIRQIVHAQQQAFTEQLNNNCIVIQNRLTAQGSGLGGRAIKEMYDMCRAVLNDRANFIWETFKRVLSALQVEWSTDLATDLKQEMAAHLNENAGEANRVFRNRIPKGLPPDELPINEHYITARLNAEIDLLVAALKVRAERVAAAEEGAVIHHNYNLTQGNMVFVSGANASANITYNAEGQAALKDALEGIAHALQESNLAEIQKMEALELTSEAIAVATTKTPNTTKLKSQLRGIAEVVGGLANASALLTALHSAAQYLGLTF